MHTHVWYQQGTQTCTLMIMYFYTLCTSEHVRVCVCVRMFVCLCACVYACACGLYLPDNRCLSV